jgi:dTDP-4-dehydrorhamnose reductase
MPKPIAWVTGAAGLIGHDIVGAAFECAPQYKVIGLTRSQVDLTDNSKLRALFLEQRPALIIHCAALSQSPACQANPALARKINVEATKYLACLASDIPFLFFSTDLVFDGRKGNYLETDAVNPLSVYAETKVTAETLVLRNPRHTVIRTSLNGGKSPSGIRGFNEELRNAWQLGKTLRLFCDEYRCPIASTVTARAVWELVHGAAAGIYHVAGAQTLSRFQIGQLLAARHPQLSPKIEATTLREYTGAPRPPDCSLNINKTQSLLSVPLPAFSKWLTESAPADF